MKASSPSAKSLMGAQLRLLAGNKSSACRANSMALPASAAVIWHSPVLAAAPAEASPWPEVPAENSAVSLIITRSARPASTAALPRQQPAITEICGTTPDRREAAPISRL